VDAYELAGFKRSDSNSSKMALTPEVAARVAEISGKAASEAAERLSIDKEWVMEKLIENVRRSLQEHPVYRNGKPTSEYRYDGPTVNRALELLGKELRMPTFAELREPSLPQSAKA
jgi:hypothetical protein